MKRTESDLVRAVLQYLATRKDVVAWRNNSGMRIGEYKGRKHVVRFGGLSGASDILGWRREVEEAYEPTTTLPYYVARFLAIECKLPGKTPTPAQQSFLELVRSHGGIAVLAYSLDDVIHGLGITC